MPCKSIKSFGLVVFGIVFVATGVMSEATQAAEHITAKYSVSSSSHDSSSEANNKALAMSYFTEIIDKRRVDLVSEVFAENAIQNFLGSPVIKGTGNIATGLLRLLSNVKEIHTDILTVIGHGDDVMFHVRHTAIGGNKAVFKNRPGVMPLILSIDGKSFSWEAMVIFKFRNGKVVEEVIIRDELGMLMQLGTVKVIEEARAGR